MKNFCGTHRFNYSGNKCPFCEQERLEKMAHRFYKEPKKNVKETVEITQNDLEKLKAKFNSR